MSTVLLGLCWPIQIDATAKAVLVSLADQASDDGDCFPAVGTIADRTCLHERTVQVAIRRLQEMGLLTVKVQGSRRRTNAYVLTPLSWQGARAIPRAQVKAQEREKRAAANGGEKPAQPGAEGAVGVAERQGGGAPGWRSSTRSGGGAPPESSMNQIHTTPLPPAEQGEGRAPAGLPQATGAAAPAQAEDGRKRKRREGAAESLRDYLARCKAEGRDAIPADDPVFAYAEQVGIGQEVLELHWREFRRRRLQTGKGQKDWPQTFRNSVRDNWYRLWFLPAGGGQALLTTAGEQARREAEAEAAAGGAAAGQGGEGGHA